MAAKAILILCTQALLTQCSLSQRICRGVGAGSPLGGQGLSYPGYMADPMKPEPWTRPIRSDIYGPYNPAMDIGASSIMPPFESPEPYVGGDMPFLMDGMNSGYNMPLITPMPMVPEMPMRFDPMPMMPEPFPMDPFPMYPEIPIITEPMPPMISDPMIMEPMYPMIDPMPMDPMYQMIPDVMYPMIPEPNCPTVTDPVCPMPMPAVECIAPTRGSPTIAPSASLSVVVMDSSIQNLFENLWNVQQ